MTTELYINAPAGTSTLAASMGATDTTVTLGSQPTTAAGQFRILVDAELILLSSPPSGNVYTVQGGLAGRGIEGTSAASHSNGSAAIVVLTSAALQSLTGGLWPYGSAIPGSVTAPVLSQAQDTTGTTPNITIQSAAAKTGSGNDGGTITFVSGAGDGLTPPFPWAPVSGQPYQGFYYTINTSVSGSTFYDLARLTYIGGGVVNLTLGGGANAVGEGVAGVEIGCYSELSIATEGRIINFQAVHDATGLTAGVFLFAADTDGADEAGFSVTVPIQHPTGGSGTVIQALAVQSGSLGASATIRYYDAQLGGVRRFSVIEQNGYAALAFYDHAGNRSYQDTTYSATTSSSAAGQTIATVPLPPGVNQCHWILSAWDTTGTNFASFEIVGCYYSNGTSSITSPSAGPSVTDTGHTSGAGTGISVTLVPTGASIAVNVTPWTSNSVHWSVRAVTAINTGQS